MNFREYENVLEQTEENKKTNEVKVRKTYREVVIDKDVRERWSEYFEGVMNVTDDRKVDVACLHWGRNTVFLISFFALSKLIPNPLSENSPQFFAFTYTFYR